MQKISKRLIHVKGHLENPYAFDYKYSWCDNHPMVEMVKTIEGAVLTADIRRCRECRQDGSCPIETFVTRLRETKRDVNQVKNLKAIAAESGLLFLTWGTPASAPGVDKPFFTFQCPKGETKRSIVILEASPFTKTI